MPFLDLPFPDDLDSAFSVFPLSSQALTKIHHKYRVSLQQVQHLHRERFEKACLDLCQIPRPSDAMPLSAVIDSLRKVSEAMYAKSVPTLKNQIIGILSKCTATTEARKPAFNTVSGFIPYYVDAIPLTYVGLL